MLHVLRLALPNVYLLTGERAILIDAGRAKDAGRILTFVRERGVEPGNLSLILLTHGHWDHAGAATELRRMSRAPIAIHRADAEFARRGVNGVLKPTKFLGRALLPILDRSYPAFEPDVLIDGEIDLNEFGVEARVLLTPGHSAGSISVLTTDREAIVGDLLMGGYFGGWLSPRSPNLHYYAENLVELRTSVQKVLAVGPRIIHPGHGGPLDPQDVAKCRL